MAFINIKTKNVPFLGAFFLLQYSTLWQRKKDSAIYYFYYVANANLDTILRKRIN